MTSSDWKIWMEELINGVEQELRSTTPIKARVALHTFRGRVSRCRDLRKRKQFERELDAFLQSKPLLRGAARRYIRKIAPPIIKAALAALKRAEPYLPKDQATGRS
jgi:hypothetical protein